MRISREGQLVTLINVFETKPEQQQELIDAWLRFVESVKEEQGLSSLAGRSPLYEVVALFERRGSLLPEWQLSLAR